MGATDFNSPSGIPFTQFYARDGLLRIDALFLAKLAATDADLHRQLLLTRGGEALAVKQESELLLALTPHLDMFIAWLFGIETEVNTLSGRHHELAPIYSVKRLFVQRKAANKYKGAAAESLDGPELTAKMNVLLGGTLTELAFAKAVTDW